MTLTCTALPAAGSLLAGAATVPDLAAVGYTETEYAVSGLARRYEADDFPADGRVQARAGDQAEFTTRVAVRRPVQPGPVTAVVEWLNVSSGDDAAPDYSYLAEEIVRRGHVWIGISAQYMGVEGGRAVVPTDGELAAKRPANGGQGLKTLDPDRYGGLDHPGDAYCYGIFTAVAEALDGPGQPLGDFDVRRRIAVGESQSAFALTTYVNAVQPLTGCFDAFLVHSRGSAAMPLGEPGTAIDLDQARQSEAVRIREDVAVPVIVLETETDVLSHRLHYWRARQPDAEHLRVWEVAGTAHADKWQIAEYESLLGCADPVNAGQQVFAVRAALRWLDTWAAGGPPAPGAPPLDLASTDPATFATDALGNTTGGVRLPSVDVATQVLTGTSLPDASIICHLFGRTLEVPTELLAATYGSREAYLRRYADAVDAAIAAGFVLPEDEAAVLADARPDLVPEPATGA